MSHHAVPVFGRKKPAASAVRACASAVSGGRRPFGGSVMMDVRHWPSIWNAPLPRSIQKVL